MIPEERLRFIGDTPRVGVLSPEGAAEEQLFA
jgi:hypothetical protein